MRGRFFVVILSTLALWAGSAEAKSQRWLRRHDCTCRELQNNIDACRGDNSCVTGCVNQCGGSCVNPGAGKTPVAQDGSMAPSKTTSTLSKAAQEIRRRLLKSR